MLRKWENLSLRIKILLLGFYIIASFTALIFLYILPAMENSIYEKKNEKIENIIQTSISIVEEMRASAVREGLTEEEAKEQAKNAIRSIRYGSTGKDYVWINDLNHIMIMHPFVPALEGKDLKEFKDKAGKFMFREFVEIGVQKGRGFTTYMWQKDDDETKIVPKMSYVQVYAPWGWEFGTGIYIEDLKSEIFAMKRNLIIVTICFIMFAGAGLSLFSVRTARKIKTLQTNLEKVSAGDLNCSIEITSTDEIGMMLHAFNDFAVRINDVIKDVRMSSEQLSSSSVELAASSDNFAKHAQNQAAASEEMTATIEEVSSGVDSIAGEVITQHEMIKTVESEVTGLDGDISEMDAQISQTRELTSKINILTKSSEDSLRSMASNMTKINTSSQEMKQIVSIINDISDRINLLSLNAAIEAARAGDSGRGFAVVADEISKLADQTASSIKEIDSRINENESEITMFSVNVDEILKFMTSIVEGIASISAMADTVNATIKTGLNRNRSISGYFENLKKRADNISVAASEQKLAMDEMVRTVSEITAVAQTTASSSEEIAASAEELSGIAEVMKSRVDYFKVKE